MGPLGPNPKVYRKDRATSTGLKLCGVGVIIVLRKESLDILYSDIRCKALFVTVKADSGTRMVICGVCIPPNSTSEAYSYFAQILEEVIASNSPLSCILFVGDNLLELNWVSPDSSLASVSETDLIDVAALLDVDQISSVRNDSGVQLDLVFCFGFCCPTALDQLLPNKSCHPPMHNRYNINSKGSSPERGRFKLNVNSYNLDGVMTFTTFIMG
ncbi:hypothetical protein J6590_086523 [Homalodisca vitripennis]|nr:hypothetical protein J6590_086523 [Homalodisca vitripennis]